MNKPCVRITFLGLCAVLGASAGWAQTISPTFSGAYTFRDIGTPAAVPGFLGGLTLAAGDSSKLLIGGAANGPNGAIYSVPLTRTLQSDGLQHITGFAAPGTQVASAPYIDGGLTYGPGGVLFVASYPTNQLLEYKPGSATPDKIIDLSAAGVAGSTGTLVFAPDGHAVIASYLSDRFYSASLTPDAAGTYDLSVNPAYVTTGNGPVGIVYVPDGSPVFSTLDPAAKWMLLTEFGAGKISAYKTDGLGLPVVDSGIDFMTGLSGAEGAMLDPGTSDFLFSTYGGGDRVLSVSGFALAVPEPGTLALFALGGLGILRRRKR